MAKPKSFRKWKYDDILNTFDLSEIHNLPSLTQWISVPPLDTLPNTMEKIRLELQENARLWNEEELKMKFIGHLISYK